MQFILIVLAVGIVLCVGMLVREREPRGRADRKASPPRSVPDVPAISVDTLIADIRKRALAYAIYRELIQSPATLEQKQKLYQTYSYVNLPPKLEEHALFSSRADLMSSQALLKDLNEWLIQQGGQPQPTFFAVSEAIGALLVERQKDRAKKIVSEVIA